MKKLLFPQRLRETPAGVLAPNEARRPFRLWMTGSLAVVMAAMVPMRDAFESDRQQAMRLLRHSRFDVSETVQRIEAAARDRGLPVLALMPGARPVLVLASSVGGTLVVMQEANSSPAMPLSVLVRAGASGGSEVLIAAAEGAIDVWQGLPAAVVDDVQALPGLVERALA
jgi:uncharacterized protein (DUF302 family)